MNNVVLSHEKKKKKHRIIPSNYTQKYIYQRRRFCKRVNLCGTPCKLERNNYYITSHRGQYGKLDPTVLRAPVGELARP